MFNRVHPRSSRSLRLRSPHEEHLAGTQSDGSTHRGWAGVAVDDGGWQRRFCVWREADSMTESHQDNYDEIYRQAERLESELRTEEARELFERAAEAGHAGSMFKLGTIYDGLGAVAGARQWYMRAIRSGDSASMFNLARLEEEVGDLLAARHWYERAAKAGDSGAMHNLGVLLQRMGDTDAAISWYEQSAANGDPGSLANLGALHEREGRPDEAESAYRRALEAGEWSVLPRLVDLLRTSGRSAEAHRLEDSTERRRSRQGSAGQPDSSSTFEPAVRLGRFTKVEGRAGGSEVGSAVSDSATTEDLIGVDAEVNRLARVLCAHATSVPLAVAILADWGSGKSSFMQMLYDRVSRSFMAAVECAGGRRSADLRDSRAAGAVQRVALQRRVRVGRHGGPTLPGARRPEGHRTLAVPSPD